jgi:DNA-binding transcriptional ArsR family regulator
MEEQDWIDAGAEVAHALAHPVRLGILELLRDEGAYVMHLTTILGRPQANVSQHLAILKDAGLVTDERDGMTVVYRVRDPKVFDLLDRLKALAAQPSRSEFGHARMPCARGAGRSHHCHCPNCSRRH